MWTERRDNLSMTDIEIIMDTMRRQITEIISADAEYFSKYNIVLSNEQQFVKPQSRDANSIYIVVKMLPSTTNFGQRVVPVTINAVSERNRLEACQRLLNEFAIANNLKSSTLTDYENDTLSHYVTQTYTTPAISSNFNEVYDGYRSLFYMSGTFLLSENANLFVLKYAKDGETSEVGTITNAFSVDVQNDTQATYASSDFTKSTPMIATISLNFTGYFTSDGIMGDLLEMIQGKDLSKTFSLVLAFRNGTEISGEFRLVNFSVQRNAGELPVASVTMTE